jgi:hypothetical protein
LNRNCRHTWSAHGCIAGGSMRGGDAHHIRHSPWLRWAEVDGEVVWRRGERANRQEAAAQGENQCGCSGCSEGVIICKEVKGSEGWVLV